MSYWQKWTQTSSPLCWITQLKQISRSRLIDFRIVHKLMKTNSFLAPQDMLNRPWCRMFFSYKAYTTQHIVFVCSTSCFGCIHNLMEVNIECIVRGWDSSFSQGHTVMKYILVCAYVSVCFFSSGWHTHCNTLFDISIYLFCPRANNNCPSCILTHSCTLPYLQFLSKLYFPLFILSYLHTTIHIAI